MRPDALTAMTRFGLGPRPGEWRTVEADPRGYVFAQLDMPDAAILTGLPDVESVRADYVAAHGAYVEERDLLKSGGSTTEAVEELRRARSRFGRGILTAEIEARYRNGVETDAPFVERLVLFWSNHFTVSAQKGFVSRVTAGLFERNAIRPHVLGYFEDMLVDAVTHPAMLHYLDNTRNIGPGSPRGQRAGVERVNENLAREVLELHTLGAEGGYTQEDVIALAEVLTGWMGTFNLRSAQPFRRALHQPGPKTVLGVTYQQDGRRQLREVLRDLAQHPSTARFVSEKLARAFVADNVSEDLKATMQDTYLETGGDLWAVYDAMISDDEAWSTPPAKMTPPYDFMVACGRSAGDQPIPPGMLIRAADQLAQGIWRANSPAGWPADDNAFMGGDAMLERIDFAQVFAMRFGVRGDTRDLADNLFGPMLDPFVEEAVARAEDSVQALVLMLMSPVYQRR